MPECEPTSLTEKSLLLCRFTLSNWVSIDSMRDIEMCGFEMNASVSSAYRDTETYIYCSILELISCGISKARAECHL